MAKTKLEEKEDKSLSLLLDRIEDVSVKLGGKVKGNNSDLTMLRLDLSKIKESLLEQESENKTLFEAWGVQFNKMSLEIDKIKKTLKEPVKELEGVGYYIVIRKQEGTYPHTFLDCAVDKYGYFKLVDKHYKDSRRFKTKQEAMKFVEELNKKQEDRAKATKMKIKKISGLELKHLLQ